MIYPYCPVSTETPILFQTEGPVYEIHLVNIGLKITVTVVLGPSPTPSKESLVFCMEFNGVKLQYKVPQRKKFWG